MTLETKCQVNSSSQVDIKSLLVLRYLDANNPVSWPWPEELSPEKHIAFYVKKTPSLWKRRLNEIGWLIVETTFLFHIINPCRDDLRIKLVQLILVHMLNSSAFDLVAWYS